MRPLLSLVLLAPALAAANGNFTISFQDPTQATVGRSTCVANPAVVFTWDNGLGMAMLGGPQEAVFLSTHSDCTQTSDTSTRILRTAQDMPTQPETFPSDGSLRIQSFPGLDNTCGGATGSTGQAFFCVVVTQNSTFGATTLTGIATLTWVTVPPPPPTGVAVQDGDSNLQVSWTWTASSANQQAQSYLVHVVAASAPAGTAPNESSLDASACSPSCGLKVGGLVNGTDYDVTVAVVDTAGDQSAFGPVDDKGNTVPVMGRPVQVQDFWRHYKDDSGGSAGGCATGGGVGLALLGLLVPLALRRRKGAVLAALLLAPAAARADFMASEPSSQEAGRWGFELDVGEYDPHVDAEFGGAKRPYHDIFGSRTPYAVTGELSWLIERSIGTLSLGVGGGFWQNIGNGFYAACPSGTTCASGGLTRSPDSTLLDIVPLSLSLEWRFDNFRKVFPLSPFAKASGLASIWWATNGTGDIATSAVGKKAKGVTYGYGLSAGVLLSLDWFENLVSGGRLTRESEVDLGLHGTALFVSYELRVLPSGASLNLSDNGWRAGLQLDF